MVIPRGNGCVVFSPRVSWMESGIELAVPENCLTFQNKHKTNQNMHKVFVVFTLNRPILDRNDHTDRLCSFQNISSQPSGHLNLDKKTQSLGIYTHQENIKRAETRSLCLFLNFLQQTCSLWNICRISQNKNAHNTAH